MKGFWKKLFTIGTVVGIGYVGYKGYQRLSNVNKMQKTLQDYLEDLLHEEPVINSNIGFNTLSIAIGLSASTLESIDFDIDEQINRYIKDYYPCLSNLKISVSKYIKSSLNDINPEEDYYTYDDLDTNEEEE